MRLTVRDSLVVLLIWLCASLQMIAAEPGDLSKLRILYVGRTPDRPIEAPSYITGKDAERFVELRKERFAAFDKFLNQHFANVKLIDATNYEVALSDNFDVTIFDEMPPGIKSVTVDGWTKQLRLPDDFDRPALMVGEVGPMTIGRFGNEYLIDHL